MNSRDIIAKPIVAIRPGKTIGKIRYPIVDAFKQEVIGFIVDDEKWFLETRLLLLPLIRGMNNDVVTVEDESSLMQISNLKAIQKQLEENIQIIGHKVLTETGKMLGYIEEFSFNHATGKIETYKIKDKNIFVSQQEIISIGKELVMVKESAAFLTDIPKITAFKENYDLNSIFEMRQMEFILGKRLSRSLETEDGHIIAREGQVINEDVIRQAKNQGKFTELVMSIESEPEL